MSAGSTATGETAQLFKAFDLAAPLPTGTTVLEASAGTGKTYTVGALVARYVAEGITTLDRLLVVTFGRAASQELRERVRDQLVAAQRELADPAAARTSSDDLLRVLSAGTDAQIEERRRRLTVALADFDAATIATTHQFCQQVLAGLGVAGDSEPDATLVEDLDDLLVEVVDDLYVRRFGPPGAEPPPLNRLEALALGRAAVGDPQARLEPVDADPQSTAALRVRFAGAVRAEFDLRKRRHGVLGYDDLLSRLATALAPDGAPARDRIRARWSVVLIDEFQDTDPVQWDVLRLAFTGVATLVLIGDPKQAIYGFRGGDVVAYLAAARLAGDHATLDVNRRSDAPVVDALQALFAGAELGDPAIVVRPVTAAHHGSRLAGTPDPAPVRLRVLRRDQFGKGPRARVKVADTRPVIARDLARDVARLLAAGADFDGRPFTAGDVAVLVNTHRQADLIRAELTDHGVRSVAGGAGSVFATDAGQDWQELLAALEQPYRSGRVRLAALTPFLGHSAADLEAGGDRLTDELGGRLQSWAELLADRGPAALLEVAEAQADMPARLLAQRGGERRLTDLRHIGALLQAALTDEGLGPVALSDWIRRRRAAADGDVAAERQRRLDSDEPGVTVLTLHVSKGLQFPVVYLPFAADRWVSTDPAVMQLHDENGARVLDVGGTAGAGRGDRYRRFHLEQAGEALRLLYVGMTRAQSAVITWWAPSANAPDSGLHRILFGRQPGNPRVAERVDVPGDETVAARLAELQAAGALVAEPADWPAVAVVPVVRPTPPLGVAGFDRAVDLSWRRASYSSLSAAGRVERTPGVASEPETGPRDDEPDSSTGLPVPAADLDPATSAVLRAVPSPMAELPSGTGFGTLVHAILETVDPTAADLGAELNARAREQLSDRSGGLAPAQLAAALVPVLTTSLGPLADGRRLADFPVTDRLTEVDFEMPLTGGDRPVGQLRLGELAPLLRSRLPVDDPLLSYADRLATPEMAGQQLRGYLTGSLDVVLRLPGPRYLIADYKTNWLGDIDDAAATPAPLGRAAAPDLAAPGPAAPDPGSAAPAALTAWHYRPAALTQSMLHSDYPLQALLYAVALHRFLRWRQPDYDPDRQLAGVLYLYVRGMCGPDTPVLDGQTCGVFGWRPPAGLVLALSDLLDQGSR